MRLREANSDSNNNANNEHTETLLLLLIIMMMIVIVMIMTIMMFIRSREANASCRPHLCLDCGGLGVLYYVVDSICMILYDTISDTDDM